MRGGQAKAGVPNLTCRLSKAQIDRSKGKASSTISSSVSPRLAFLGE